MICPFDPDLNVKDFSAVHEAYQYLFVEYVEKVMIECHESWEYVHP